eukprot:Mycagemm_TRINITY_DN8211_c0_g1::TRINITY_DN8211_c0_g1_i1::g.1926::m.1926 type:complete len:444 gc:universal TRINITY_DN8211_c0_g1_i1:64-1395(+)
MTEVDVALRPVPLDTSKPSGELDEADRLRLVLCSSVSTALQATLPIPQSLCDEFNVEVISAPTSVPAIIKQKIASEGIVEGPFFVVDLGVLARQYQKWVTLMPRIKPFYAIKCNPEPALIKTLAALGAGFDCASWGEINQVLSYGIEPDRIIMANPCKPPSHIVSARNHGVFKFTFDNVDELQKIKKCCPQAEVVLRILPDDSHSIMRFGSKFGAPVSSWAKIFSACRDLSLKLIGVSFHVGSGCMSAVAFSEALRLARCAFDAAAQFGFNMDFLDIGGGFPGDDNSAVTFPEIAAAVTPVVDELFPPHVTVIGEPGRYMAAATHSLATSVCSRRCIEPDTDELRYLYYINDGVYGSFNCIFFDHAHPAPIPLNSHPKDPKFTSKVFGPTCDSLDVVAAKVELPEMDVGDWIYFETMGAYTTAAGSSFNGFKTRTMFFVYTTA